MAYFKQANYTLFGKNMLRSYRVRNSRSALLQAQSTKKDLFDCLYDLLAKYGSEMGRIM